MYGRRDISSFVKGEDLTSTLNPPPPHPPQTEEKVQSFKEPEWTAEPTYTEARLEVFKSDEKIDTVPLGAKKYIVFGRSPEVCDVLLDHTSISRKHAAIVHHTSGKVYLIDLQSGNGTFVDDVRIKAHSPISLKEGTTIKFGASSRIYIATGVGDGKDKDKKRKADDGESSGKKSKIEGKAPKKEPATVRCRHILAKHKGSRNPSSWRQPRITQTKEEAIRIIKAFREQILSGEKEFEAIATTESDCPSAKRGGDLGPFTRGKMQKPFEDASFALEVGEISDIVDTDSGIHIIKRIE